MNDKTILVAAADSDPVVRGTLAQQVAARDRKEIAVVFIGAGDPPMGGMGSMGVMGSDVKELARLSQSLAVQLAEVRSQRDLWESMHRNQCAVNEPIHQLAGEQRELIERLRVQVNQFERLLGLIPCTGDFDRACEWVTSVTAKGAGARPPQGTNESHCVAEVLSASCQVVLRCSNCNEVVCSGSLATGQSPQQWGVEQETAWENHCASARPRGEKTGGTPAPQFPHGRFAEKAKGGV